MVRTLDMAVAIRLDAVTMLLYLLYLAIFCTASSNSASTRNVPVTIDSDNVINIVDERFLSITSGIESYLLNHFINFSSPRLRTLMSHLSPAVLRVGGTAADVLVYNETSNKRNAIVTKDNITALVDVTKSTNTRLIFDLNQQLRNGSEWDSTNAEKLIKFCSEMDYCNSMDWELGNEPESYRKNNRQVLTAQQIGDGYVKLNSLLHSDHNCQNSFIVGPALGRFIKPKLQKLFSSFVDITGSFLKAATIHHYYFRGPTATKETYMNASYFADLLKIITKANSLIKASKYPELPLWLGETSSGYGGGTADVSDRFVSGFLWMEKLGIAAANGVKVVCRQTLYRSHYALIDGSFNPNPDYWLSWIHKKFVGQKVFAVNLTDLPTPPTTRVYAHCTNTASSSYEAGAVTVFALNVDTIKNSVLTFNGPFANQNYESYLLEPSVSGDVLSKSVKLNGQTLTMPSDETMPEIVPVNQSAGSTFALPTATMAFLVFPKANIQSCQ